jgi:mono/diheme cytochrome c family protein
MTTKATFGQDKNFHVKESNMQAHIERLRPQSVRKTWTRQTLLMLPMLLPLCPLTHAQTPLERGSYLVNTVMACAICHAPRGPNGLPLDKNFSGGPQTFVEPTYTAKGSNITPDVATGIGAWSDADIKRALTQGVRPNGSALAPIMTSAYYKVLSPDDLNAIVIYLRSLPAVSNAVQAPVYKPPMPNVQLPGAAAPMTASRLADRVQRGFYLASLAHCMECHARRADGEHDLVNGLGRGGHVMGINAPYGPTLVRNITSHPTAGIGAWSDDEIKRALTHAVARDGRPFRPPMNRAAYYSKMAPEDLDALVAYLRTLPPLE